MVFRKGKETFSRQNTFGKVPIYEDISGSWNESSIKTLLLLRKPQLSTGAAYILSLTHVEINN